MRLILSFLWLLFAGRAICRPVSETIEKATEEVLKNVNSLIYKPSYFFDGYFKGLVKDRNGGAQLYDRLTAHFKLVDGLNLPFMDDLKLFAFNHGFPDQFYHLTEILNYADKRTEIKDMLIRSDAFNKFSDNEDVLESLVAKIYKADKLDQKKRWEWIHYRVEHYWGPKLLSHVEISTDPVFLNFLKEELRALMLFEYLLEVSGNEIDRFDLNVLELIADAATSSLERMNDIVDITKKVKHYEDLGFADVMPLSSHYVKIIGDPFRAYYLRNNLNWPIYKVRKFQNFLSEASMRNYKSEIDVLRTFQNVGSPQEAFLFELQRFPPYRNYISYHDRALSLMTTLAGRYDIPKNDLIMNQLKDIVSRKSK